MAFSARDISKHAIPMPVDLDMDSIGCKLHRTAGRMAINTVDYSPPALADYFSDIFQVIGLVELKAIYGEFTDVTAVANGPSTCYFQLYAAPNAVDLSLAAGVDATGAAAGSVIAKTAAMATAATFLNASQCRVAEVTVGGAARPFFSSLLLADSAANTYIRWRYSTVGACTFTVSWVAIWACRYPGSSLIAV